MRFPAGLVAASGVEGAYGGFQCRLVEASTWRRSFRLRWDLEKASGCRLVEALVSRDLQRVMALNKSIASWLDFAGATMLSFGSFEN